VKDARAARRAVDDGVAHRPIGLSVLCIFFAIACAIALTVAVSLALPDSPLEPMWRLKPRARLELGALGLWAVVLMLAVSAACAVCAVGLWRGARWGHVAAVGMLAVHLVADTLTVVLGIEPRALVGIPVVAAIIGYLLTRRVRSFFARSAGQV
jgi:uncharacterized membrane protein (DUF2068 family)